MPYKSILVSLDNSDASAKRVNIAATLAVCFDARLVGFAARDFTAQSVGDAIASAIVPEAELEHAAREFGEIERRFREAAAPQTAVKFTSAIGSPDISIVALARSADLVVAGARSAHSEADLMTVVDPGQAVIRIGGPLLVVPHAVDVLHAMRVLVAWSDTFQCRRAVRNALPLLKRAKEVYLCHAGPSKDEQSVDDVAGYLNRHAVHTTARLIQESPNTTSDELFANAAETHSDLIVAGAYGHHPLLEWAVGGVTKDLLERSPICCLLSH